MKSLSKDDLRKKVEDWQKDMFRFRCEKKTGQLENTTVIPKTRKSIARAKTLLNRKDNG